MRGAIPQELRRGNLPFPPKSLYIQPSLTVCAFGTRTTGDSCPSHPTGFTRRRQPRPLTSSPNQQPIRPEGPWPSIYRRVSRRSVRSDQPPGLGCFLCAVRSPSGLGCEQPFEQNAAMGLLEEGGVKGGRPPFGLIKRGSPPLQKKPCRNTLVPYSQIQNHYIHNSIFRASANGKPI